MGDSEPLQQAKAIATALEQLADQLRLPLTAVSVADPAAATTAAVYEVPSDGLAMIEPGKVSAACGEAAYRFCLAAIDAALAGTVAAVVTGPLNKEAWDAAGHHYPGHTELFAERLAADRSCMLQYADDIACSFVTTHVGYAGVPALLTSERIADVLDLTAAALRRIRGRPPRLLVCGLNPHAGEFGTILSRQSEDES